MLLLSSTKIWFAVFLSPVLCTTMGIQWLTTPKKRTKTAWA